jgi:hypothetical protein
MATQKTRQAFTDPYIGALQDFGIRGMMWDTKVAGLRLRVGAHKFSWSFFMQHRFRGKRSTTCKALGSWPSVNVADARAAALVEAGRIAARGPVPGRRDATKFADAFERYVEHLKRQSADRGKKPLWADNVVKLGRILLPEFGKWSLAEMSNSPDAIEAWHRKLSSRAPFSANRCAELIRVIYRRAARRVGSRVQFREAARDRHSRFRGVA